MESTPQGWESEGQTGNPAEGKKLPRIIADLSIRIEGGVVDEWLCVFSMIMLDSSESLSECV